MRPTQNARQVAVVGPRGRSDVYVEQSDGTYQPRQDIAVSLSKRPEGGWIAKQEDGSVWTFKAGGDLIKIEQPNNPPLLVQQPSCCSTTTRPAADSSW